MKKQKQMECERISDMCHFKLFLEQRKNIYIYFKLCMSCKTFEILMLSRHLNFVNYIKWRRKWKKWYTKTCMNACKMQRIASSIDFFGCWFLWPVTERQKGNTKTTNCHRHIIESCVCFNYIIFCPFVSVNMLAYKHKVK